MRCELLTAAGIKMQILAL